MLVSSIEREKRYPSIPRSGANNNKLTRFIANLAPRIRHLYKSALHNRETNNAHSKDERLHLLYETGVQGRVSYQNTPRILTASADNGLWHEDAEKLGPSLVVVLEGRKRDGSVSTETECPGFMGECVLDIRRGGRMEDTD